MKPFLFLLFVLMTPQMNFAGRFTCTLPDTVCSEDYRDSVLVRRFCKLYSKKKRLRYTSLLRYDSDSSGRFFYEVSNTHYYYPLFRGKKSHGRLVKVRTKRFYDGKLTDDYKLKTRSWCIKRGGKVFTKILRKKKFFFENGEKERRNERQVSLFPRHNRWPPPF